MVIDASAVVEYLVVLTLTDAATRLFHRAAAGHVELWAPDLVHVELWAPDLVYEEVRMRRTLALCLILVGTGALLAIVPLSRGTHENEAITRSFTFSSDPEVAVLTITHIGGLSGGRTVYILYGDGRLRQEIRTRTGEVRQAMEASLPYEETRDFLEVAVAHGLLDISPEELLAEIKYPPAIQDAGTMVVEIHLTSYTRNGEELGPASNTLRLEAPRAQRQKNSGSEPIAGMAALSDHLSRLRERLEQGGLR